MSIFFLLFLCLVSVLCVVVAIVFLSFGFPLLPFVPSAMNRVEALVSISGVNAGEKVVDIGSGDGRIVIAFATQGAIAHGYEINPLLVWWSRRQIRKRGLEKQAYIYQKNFWNADFSSYDIIALYGIDPIMKRLEAFLLPQLKKGARIVVSGTTFPSLPLAKEQDNVRLYVN